MSTPKVLAAVVVFILLPGFITVGSAVTDQLGNGVAWWVVPACGLFMLLVSGLMTVLVYSLFKLFTSK